MQAIDELARRVDEADQDAEDELPAEAALDAKDLAFLRVRAGTGSRARRRSATKTASR